MLFACLLTHQPDSKKPTDEYHHERNRQDVEVFVYKRLYTRPEHPYQSTNQEESTGTSQDGRPYQSGDTDVEHAGCDREDLVGYRREAGDRDRGERVLLILLTD